MTDSPSGSSGLEGASRPRRLLGECAGACGDLGTFIPHVIGALTVAGLAPAGVLYGFGVCFLAAGLFYRAPLYQRHQGLTVAQSR